MFKEKLRQESGQSIVEVIVGLSLIVVGLSAAVTLLSQAFFINKNLENQTIGTYLAAEGIEIAKNLIDHDVYANLAGTRNPGWGNCFGGGVADVELDYLSTSCPLQPYNANDMLYYDPGTHMYSYTDNGNSVKTIFNREVRVKTLGNEIIVNSIVTWQQGGGSYNVNLEDHFYNSNPIENQS